MTDKLSRDVRKALELAGDVNDDRGAGPGGMTCEGCAWFKYAGRDEGICRAHPPMMGMALNPMTGQPALTSNFPPSRTYWWCGEWKAREQR